MSGLGKRSLAIENIITLLAREKALDLWSWAAYLRAIEVTQGTFETRFSMLFKVTWKALLEAKAKHKMNDMQKLMNAVMSFDEKLRDSNFLVSVFYNTNTVLLAACEFKPEVDSDDDNDESSDDEPHPRNSDMQPTGPTLATRDYDGDFSEGGDDDYIFQGQMLPLHYVCHSKKITSDAVELLCHIHPEEAKKKSKSGKLPLHVACGNHGVTSNMIHTLLIANPEAPTVAAQVQDEEARRRKSEAMGRFRQQALEDNLLGMMDVVRADTGLVNKENQGERGKCFVHGISSLTYLSLSQMTASPSRTAELRFTLRVRTKK